MKIDALVFDLGNVLIDWNPDYLYREIIPDDAERAYFLSNICTLQWHSFQDAGRDPGEATRQLAAQHPQWKEAIECYYTRWPNMFRGTVKGSVAILEQLKRKGIPLYALSNWNRELYRHTEHDFPFLALFDDVILSSDTGWAKPDERIFHYLFQKHSLIPEQTLFIDDRKDNTEVARKLGMQVHLFTTSSQLLSTLKSLEILS